MCRIWEKKYLYPLIIFIVLVIYLLHNFWWISADKSPVFGDEIDHIEFSYDYYFLAKEGKIARYFLVPPTFYPPLMYYVSTVFYFIFGRTYMVTVFSQSIFLILLAYSVYFASSQLWNRDVGILAAFAAITYPLMSYLSHKYFQDLPLAATTAFAMLCLLKVDTFKHKKWTYLFFIASAVAMLAKINYFFFFIFPFARTAWIFVKDIWNNRNERNKLLKYFLLLTVITIADIFVSTLDTLEKAINDFLAGNPMVFTLFFIGGLLPLVICLYFIVKTKFEYPQIRNFLVGSSIFLLIIYYFHLFHMDRIYSHAQGQSAVGNNTAGLLDFMNLYTGGFMGIAWFVTMIIGMIWYLLDKNKNYDRTTFLISILGISVLHYVFPFKENRYFMPIVIFSAPFAVYWMTKIKLKFIRIPVIIFFLFCNVFGVAGYHLYNPGKNNPYYNIHWNFSHFRFTQPAPYPEDYWSVKEIYKTAEEYGRNQKCLYLIMLERNIRENLSFRFYLMELQHHIKSRLFFIKNLKGQSFNYPESNINIYSFLLGNIPKGDKTASFDYLITVYVRTTDIKENIPGSIQEKMKKIGIPVNIIENREIKYSRAPLKADISKIPLKPSVMVSVKNFELWRSIVYVTEIQKIFGKKSYY